MNATTLMVAAALVTSLPGFAQWLDYPTPGIPRTVDGKPNLSAPAPRTADGKPDLSGLWYRDSARLFQDIAADFKPGELPIQPWAAAVAKEREQANRKDDPYSHCMPPSVPRINSGNHPFKILQTPGLIAILYETSNTFRQIYTDGRPLPKDPQPSWLGYSTARWNGDTLVVETAGFNDQNWLDGDKGRPQTTALHVTERFHRINFGLLEIEATIDDPKAYTRPFSTKESLHLLADSDLIENICENERDASHLVGK
jgi:hypothetical protein